MFKPIQSILFATNLTKGCIPAFEMAASLATHHQATLVLIHVLQQIPEYIETRLKSLFGEQGYDDLVQRNSNSARHALIGKQFSSTLVHEALKQFCTNAGIDDDACNYQSRKIIVTTGDLTDEILENAEKHDCSLIVMGAREGFIADNSIGYTIKSIMRRSKIPVIMVPPPQE
ncbi:MAG: universal stress protein [Desulfobacterium sp.]